MTLKYHKTLTEEKWSGFPFYKQILMIANELNRAKNWLEKKDLSEVKLCYERAIELLCLTIEVLKEKRKLKELLRFKEMLAMQYSDNFARPKENLDLLRVLVSLDKDSFAMLNP